MEFLNVGIGEMVMIVVIALLVFGPERLPEVARRAARFINEIRKVANDVQRTFLDETQEIRMPLEEIKKDITSVGEPLKELRQEGTAIKSDFLNNTQAAVNEVKTPTTVSANGTAKEPSRPYKPNSSDDATPE